jgi:NADPH:quinone reductase-like Zn-dependent oxidoreductase
VEVFAASLNPIDNILRAGFLRQMLELTFPHVKGYDVSGTVVEIGKNVKSVKIGDEVFARPNQMDAGSVAEFARIQEDELAIKPSNMTHEQAASIPLAGLTAWQALVTKGMIKKGSKVLIHAGSGGVGTLAIQIAKHFGAFVATTTSGKNTGLVKELGADLVIDYTTQNFEEELSDCDLVIDTIGGETLTRSFKVLKKGGTMVSVKSQDNENLAEKYGVHFEWFFMSPDGKMLSELAKLISQGAVKTVIDSVFHMDQAAQAFDRLSTGRAKGKIVIAVK